MLEALRKNSKNTIIVVLFGLIIAAFVINFGPGSQGCGDTPGTSYAAKIRGTSLSEADFRYAYIVSGGANYSPQAAKLRRFKEFVMDHLIERELWAQEASRLGISVSQKEVEDMIAEGRMYVLGVPRRVDDYVFVGGEFNYERFKNLCQNRFGLTVVRFLEQQQREVMAERARQLVYASVQVTPEQVKTDFEQRERQVNLEFVRFQSRPSPDAVPLTPAQVAEYRKAHEADIRKYYDEHGYLYKKLDKHAHIERILVAVAKDAKPEVKAAAKDKAEQALRRVRAGEAFDVVARAMSDDSVSKPRGGKVGWRKKGATGLDNAIDDAIFGATAGAMLGPLESDQGFEVLRVSGFREGDLKLDAVADEIAEEQARMEQAKAEAKAQAEQALAKLKAGAKLADLFPKPSDEDERDPIKRASAPPSVRETGAFSRRGELVPNIGVSAELMRRAFELKPDEVAGPFDVSSSWFVVRLKERKEPDMESYAKRQAELQSEYRRRKWYNLIESWGHNRCVEARDKGDLTVNEAAMVYEGTVKPSQAETRYQPCATGDSRFSRFPGVSVFEQ